MRWRGRDRPSGNRFIALCFDRQQDAFSVESRGGISSGGPTNRRAGGRAPHSSFTAGAISAVFTTTLTPPPPLAQLSQSIYGPLPLPSRVKTLLPLDSYSASLKPSEQIERKSNSAAFLLGDEKSFDKSSIHGRSHRDS